MNTGRNHVRKISTQAFYKDTEREKDLIKPNFFNLNFSCQVWLFIQASETITAWHPHEKAAPCLTYNNMTATLFEQVPEADNTAVWQRGERGLK